MSGRLDGSSSIMTSLVPGMQFSDDEANLEDYMRNSAVEMATKIMETDLLKESDCRPNDCGDSADLKALVKMEWPVVPMVSEAGGQLDRTPAETGNCTNTGSSSDATARMDGIWVQCTTPCCKKWRFLPVLDPCEVSEDWTCAMNPDAEYNECSKGQQSYAEVDDDYIYGQFAEGSLVWAKMAAYPWWPAMVESDPDLDTFYICGDDPTNVTKYHVVFLDDKVSRTWLHVSKIKPYKVQQPEATDLLKNRVPNQFKWSLKQAINNAERAAVMPLKERLAQFSFGKRYQNGKLHVYRRTKIENAVPSTKAAAVKERTRKTTAKSVAVKVVRRSSESDGTDEPCKVFGQSGQISLLKVKSPVADRTSKMLGEAATPRFVVSEIDDDLVSETENSPPVVDEIWNVCKGTKCSDGNLNVSEDAKSDSVDDCCSPDGIKRQRIEIEKNASVEALLNSALEGVAMTTYEDDVGESVEMTTKNAAVGSNRPVSESFKLGVDSAESAPIIGSKAAESEQIVAEKTMKKKRAYKKKSPGEMKGQLESGEKNGGGSGSVAKSCNTAVELQPVITLESGPIPTEKKKRVYKKKLLGEMKGQLESGEKNGDGSGSVAKSCNTAVELQPVITLESGLIPTEKKKKRVYKKKLPSEKTGQLESGNKNDDDNGTLAESGNSAVEFQPVKTAESGLIPTEKKKRVHRKKLSIEVQGKSESDMALDDGDGALVSCMEPETVKTVKNNKQPGLSKPKKSSRNEVLPAVGTGMMVPGDDKMTKPMKVSKTDGMKTNSVKSADPSECRQFVNQCCTDSAGLSEAVKVTENDAVAVDDKAETPDRGSMELSDRKTENIAAVKPVNKLCAVEVACDESITSLKLIESSMGLPPVALKQKRKCPQKSLFGTSAACKENENTRNMEELSLPDVAPNKRIKIGNSVKCVKDKSMEYEYAGFMSSAAETAVECLMTKVLVPSASHNDDVNAQKAVEHGERRGKMEKKPRKSVEKNGSSTAAGPGTSAECCDKLNKSSLQRKPTFKKTLGATIKKLPEMTLLPVREESSVPTEMLIPENGYVSDVQQPETGAVKSPAVDNTVVKKLKPVFTKKQKSAAEPTVVSDSAAGTEVL